ncbi:hypothetical protein J4E82_008688 [Alternaria postmessia]|uniref:uncharacterized protein n=1 Tax=Alternaria postmessia TaxID=1187938 RepID=UPI0022255519|nr:uncharacterized protein J4E82_008688 [Alternaria postmessia]KAI5372585.1 hypothetical protein J4E82_008688 [Alternaria postmessia]
MRLKMLNGAPLRGYLNFDDDKLLPVEECRLFDAASSTLSSTNDSTPVIKWRGISYGDSRLRTGWSQPILPDCSPGREMPDLSLANVKESVSFLPEDTTSLESKIAFEDPSLATNSFLEQSLMFHDTLLSSKVLPDDMTDRTISSSSFLTTSFGTTPSEFSSPSKVGEHTVNIQVPPKMAITPLESLPSAQRLRAIYPQTPTPNFLCAVTATPEQKEVFVRKGGYKMKLWEIIVADDTRSNFKVTFWLRPPRESNNEQDHVQNLLLQTLKGIKVGDILLLRNIALTSFGDNVFGQSLNPTIARARTSIDVLTKSGAGSSAQLGGLPAPVAETLKRVKKWAKMHIASDTAGSRKRKGSAAKQGKYAKRTYRSFDVDDSMPPDTMESV